MEIVQHVADDMLERYAMRTLPAAEAVPVEEHLLTCQNWRRLQVEIDFVTAMRAAAVKIREDEQA